MLLSVLFAWKTNVYKTQSHFCCVGSLRQYTNTITGKENKMDFFNSIDNETEKYLAVTEAHNLFHHAQRTSSKGKYAFCEYVTQNTVVC